MGKPQKTKTKWWSDAIWGSLIGFINGFLGSGGGMLAVPILEKTKNLESKKAHATAIAVMLPFSLINSAVYIFNLDFDWLMVLAITLSATVGGVLGCFFLKNLSNKIIKLIFAVVMAFAGVWILIS